MRTTMLPLLVLLSACGRLKETFPSHDAVYAPVEPTIGEMRLVGSDTMWAASGRGWTLIASNRRTLEDLHAAFDGAAMGWQRTFGTVPPQVVVRLTSEKDAAPFLTRDAQASNVLVVSSNVRLLPMFGRRARLGDPIEGPDMSDLRASFLASTLVHAWMSLAADALAPRDLSGTTVLANGTSGGFPFMTDARIPAWIAIALPALFTNSEMLDIAPMEIARDVNRLVPVSQLVTMSVPKPDTSRAAESDPAQRALWPESLAFGQYLFENEGVTFFRDVFTRSLARQTLPELLEGAQHVPTDPAALDTAFRKWAQAQSMDPMGDRRR